jgi:hypothetical protein
MLNIIRLCLGTLARLSCTRRRLMLENLALRQQLAVFKRRHPMPRLTLLDKLFIGHDQRRILHFHVTRHPTNLWVVQQLREASPYQTALVLIYG